MTRVTVRASIDAPVEVVFAAVTDIENLPATNPDIAKIEFLGERRSGVGTRFRETRMMKGKPAVTDLEVTEFVENERARMVTDSHGTVWDTLFTVRATGGETELTIAMDARPHKLLPRVMVPIFKGMFRKGMVGHVEQVKAYCEEKAREA